MKITQNLLIFCLVCLLTQAKCDNFSDTVNYKPSKETGMDNKQLDDLLRKNCEVVKGQLGFWDVKYKGYSVTIITDETHNRMRIVCAVIEEAKLKKGDLEVILSANFDKALDAKYALYKGYLWSVFSHPLKELQPDQFIDALLQVVTLTANYGTSYTSTDLIFGGGK